MKLTQLSLVAILASNLAVAGGNIVPAESIAEALMPAPSGSNSTSSATLTGNAKLWYGTSGSNMFSKRNSWGDAYADIKYERKISEDITLNLGMAYLSTLGLENELVSGTWVNHGPKAVNDAAWLNEANVVIGLPSVDSFLKIGRQELDTPFFFSETWSIATNTFDGAVGASI